MFPINRIEGFYPDAPEPIPPDRRTTADKLLAGAWCAKISLLKIADDDGVEECSVEVEIKSSFEGPADDVMAGLLAQFRTPRTEGGVA